jgi:hypothetical protein
MGPDGCMLGKARTETTVFENDLLVAMTHEKPACLYGKEAGSLSMQDEAFEACPTYNKWIGIMGGIFS